MRVLLYSMIFMTMLIGTTASAQPGHDDVGTSAKQLVELRDAMVEKDPRQAPMLYLPQLFNRFKDAIGSVTLHRGMDVDAARFMDIAWITVNFKDGSSAMMVVNLGRLPIEDVIRISRGERKAIEGPTPVPNGQTIDVVKKTATAYEIKDFQKLLTQTLGQHRLSLLTLKELPGDVVTGQLQYVPNTGHRYGQGDPASSGGTHGSGFQDRIRQQGNRDRTQGNNLPPRAPRRR